MSTTNFTGAQIAPYLYGRIDAITNATRYTHRTIGSGFHGYITGTDASLNMTASSATPFDVSVDGGAYSSPTLTPLTSGALPLFSALSDTPHLVDVRLRSGFAGTSVFLLAAGALSVTGAAPAISADTNYGIQLISRSGYKVFSTVNSDSSTLSLAPGFGGSGYVSVPPVGSGGGFYGNVIRARGRADKIWAYTGTNAKWIALEKDGVRIASVLTSGITNGSYVWVQIASGLDDGSEHEWTLVCAGNGGGNQTLDAIMLGGSSAAVSSTMPGVRSHIMAIGDSLTAAADGGGAGTTQGDGSLGWPYVLARLLGKDAIVNGRSGTLTITGAQQVAYDLAQAAGSFGVYPTHLAVLYGRNNSDTSTTQTDYTTLLQQALGTPQFTGKIVAITVPQLGSWATAGALVNTGIRNAVAAVNSPRVTLLEGATWTDVTTGTDNTHWDIAGHALFAQRCKDSGVFADAALSGFKRVSFNGGF